MVIELAESLSYFLFIDAVYDIIDGLPSSMQFFIHGGNIENVKFPSTSLDQDLKDASSDAPIVDYKKSFKGKVTSYRDAPFETLFCCRNRNIVLSQMTLSTFSPLVQRDFQRLLR